MAEQRCLAGLDIGSTSCKIIVYDTRGNTLGRVSRDCPITRAMGAHEADAQAIADTVLAVIREAAGKYPGIAGIGVASFGESFVLLDENDAPLLPVMLYTDPRGEEESGQLASLLGEEQIIAVAGVKPAAMYSLPKLMWVKSHYPDVWKKVRRICLMEDYLVYLLTGRAQIDYSLAARTMAFDIHRLSWSHALLNAAGVDPALLSEPVPTGTSAGRIKPERAESLGLDPDTLIVSVSHDQVAAAIGSSVFDESCAVNGAGTVECITPVFTDCDSAVLARGGYSIVPFITPGTYVCYAFSFTGGSLIKWVIDALAGDARARAAREGRDVYGVLDEACADAPTGLLALPHFAGAATPYMDSGSRGAILGLTLETTVADLYRAAMECVCYEMRLNMEFLAEGGVNIPALRAAGGGARNRMWMQMKADILGVPVTALATADSGTTGSAMLAGIACGAFRDLAHASGVMVKEKETFLPRPAAQAAYEPHYRRYKKLYAAVRPLMEV